MAADPLKQFEIQTIFPMPSIAGVDLSFTNSALYMLLAAVLTVALIIIPMGKRALVPGRLQSLAEMYHAFVVTLVKDTASPDARKFFPFMFTLFSFILFGNLLGMLPMAFTFTSHIAVTFTLAIIVFIVVVATGFVTHGLKFFSLFLPEGTPWYIAPILVPIEVFSFFIRPVTLAVRLFANMLAGHVLLKVMIGLAATAGFFGILPFAATIAFIGFEFFVAALQAYIFTLLACVYLQEALHMH